MFDALAPLPADPLLNLITRFGADDRSDKVDLGVGVYRDAIGATPVLETVKVAEAWLLANESSKSYVGARGNLAFCGGLRELLFGTADIEQRTAFIQTPGGCGALRVLAELAMATQRSPRIWVSNPTWANHIPLLGFAGLQIEHYPYYDAPSSQLDFDGMMTVLTQAERGDLVLLHASCHNPSGADLSQSQWGAVIALCAERGLVPLIDVAYQGFGEGLEADVYGLRLAAQQLDEVLVAVSCSKNFGLYRERVGAAFALVRDGKTAQAVNSHMVSTARGMYSMPPAHGASVVQHILQSDELRGRWEGELEGMRARILSMREALQEAFHARGLGARFAFIPQQRGMFSFLGISQTAVAELADKYAIYMADSSRINIAGLSAASVSYVADSVAQVLE